MNLQEESTSIKQGDSDCEASTCFCTKFNLSVDLTVIVSYNGLRIYLTSFSRTCGIVRYPYKHSVLSMCHNNK